MLSIFKKDTYTSSELASNIKDLIHDGNDYFSDELIVLDEQLAGNLFCAEKVVIEQHGVLTGNITSKTCLVTGMVRGDILSLDLLDIQASAVVMGNIHSAKVNIEPGAVINGYITVGEDIEALTIQWNKTKFSTDDYLTTKVNKELSQLDKISAVNTAAPQKTEPVKAAEPIGVMAAIQPKPVAAEVKSKPLMAAAPSPKAGVVTDEAIIVVKPPLAAATPPKTDEAANNQRWW